MINYIDYDFYKNKYMGDMPEENFEKLALRASAEVRKNIFDRDITNYENEVQMATCSVADILLKVEQLENKKDTILSNNNLKSESVGDYSRTFDTLEIDNVNVEISNQKEKIKEELRRYLLYTGLLYRGA